MKIAVFPLIFILISIPFAPLQAQATDPCESAETQLTYYFLEYNADGYLNQKYLENLFYACDSVSLSSEVAYYYLRSVALLEVEDNYVAKPSDIFYFFYQNFKTAAAKYVRQDQADPEFLNRLSLRTDQLQADVERAEKYGDQPFLDGRDVPQGEQPIAGQRGQKTRAELNFPNFPYPPEAYSDFLLLQGNTFTQVNTLGEMDAFLVQTLNGVGYYGKKYFSLPEGFALVTQLERVYPDGSPYPTIDRWSNSVKHKNTFSLRQYFLSLVFAEPGDYRAFAFVILPRSVAENPLLGAGRLDPKAWQGTTGEKLPDNIAQLTINSAYEVRLYCFVFHQGEDAEGAFLQALPLQFEAGSFAQQQLIKAGLLPTLNR